MPAKGEISRPIKDMRPAIVEASPMSFLMLKAYWVISG